MTASVLSAAALVKQLCPVRAVDNVPVELVVKKAGGVAPHDITIKAPEAGIDFSESLGSEPKSIKFTPVKTGTYPFECTKRFLFFKSHKDRGMHGVLEVVE